MTWRFFVPIATPQIFALMGTALLLDTAIIVDE